MTDLLHIIPSFPTNSYTHLLPSLEKELITTTDLLTLDALEIAKRAQLPLLDVRRLANHVVRTLQGELGLSKVQEKDDSDGAEAEGTTESRTLRRSRRELAEGWRIISTLDEELDAALGGGVPTGYITEITGESGAGKTQFLLTLLLTAQLPPPHGLSRNTLYISTESPLSTPRLSQLLTTHPHLSTLSPSSRPSLDRVLSIQTPDLESQDHILTYQLPVAIARHNIGLVVLDSVAANYRAEFSNAQAGTGTARSGLAMAKRSAELVRLGQLLRTLARTHDLAVVVANQVADRFTQVKAPSRPSSHHMPSSPAEIMPPPPPSSSTAPLSSSQPSLAADHNRTSTPSISAAAAAAAATPLTLDHQQRFFTGWGDLPLSTPHTNTLTTINNNNNNHTNLKTPSLGLTWTNQLACRIALLKEPVYTDTSTATNTTINKQNWPTNESSGEKTLIRWRRWMKVVFAPWVAGAEGQRGVEFEITGTGLRSLHPAMEDHGVEGAQPFHRLTR